MVYERFSLIT